MDILLTFVGFHDPYARGLIGQDDQSGPILSLINNKVFDHVYLLSTPNVTEHAENTKQAILDVRHEVSVEILDIPMADPTNYFEILRGLRNNIPSIMEKSLGSNIFVSVASGTPQMHAIWLLLAACGELPARILHVRPPIYVTKDRPMISEVDITSQDFPIVRSNICKIELTEELYGDAEEIIGMLGIVGRHPKIRAALETAAALADADVPILISGETGTGKELFARYVHLLSGRPPEKFVPVNCAAIPHDLVESLLFGHTKGAFTGAISDQQGKFKMANRGTLFLDELAELPLAVQAKLLRVLQDGFIEPVGSESVHEVNVRIIAATNKNLGKLIRKGDFREDLYYRLNVGEIVLPSLRERKTDIPSIALYVLDRINKNLRVPKRLSASALSRLQNHNWPGNVRDLENVLERSLRLTKKIVLDSDDLIILDPITYSDPLSVLPEPARGFSLEKYLSGARKQLILRALEIAGGNKSEAARILGITPQAVHKFAKDIEQN